MLHKVLLICHLSPHLSQPQWRIKHTAVRHPEKQALGIDPKAGAAVFRFCSLPLPRKSREWKTTASHFHSKIHLGALFQQQRPLLGVKGIKMTRKQMSFAFENIFLLLINQLDAQQDIWAGKWAGCGSVTSAKNRRHVTEVASITSR